MKEQSINRQILIWMLLVSLFPLLLLTSFYLYSYIQNFKQQKIEQLNLVADKKTIQINEYIDERIKDAILAANTPNTTDGLKLLISKFEQRLNKQLEYQQLLEESAKKFQIFIEKGFYMIFFLFLHPRILFSP